MCLLQVNREDRHSQSREKEKTEHGCILASRMNPGYSFHWAILPRYCRNTYIKPQYSGVKPYGWYKQQRREGVLYKCDISFLSRGFSLFLLILIYLLHGTDSESRKVKKESYLGLEEMSMAEQDKQAGLNSEGKRTGPFLCFSFR